MPGGRRAKRSRRSFQSNANPRAYWYLRALPQLTDLDRTKAEMRTDQATGQTPPQQSKTAGLTASELEQQAQKCATAREHRSSINNSW